MQGAGARLDVYRRLLRQARPYWPHITGIFLLNLVSTPLSLLTPLPLKIVVDNVIGSHPLPGFLRSILPSAATVSAGGVLAVAVGLLVAVALVRQLQNLASTLLSAYTAERLVLEFRTVLFRHVQRVSLRYHDTKGTADSIYRIQADAPSIQYIAIDGALPFISSAVTFLAMLIVTLRIDWQLGLVALGVSPLLIWASSTFRSKLRQRWRDAKHLQSAAMSVVHEALGAVRIVKAFGQERHEEQRFLHRSGESIIARLRVAMLERSFDLVIGLTTTAGMAIVLLVGVRHVQSGTLTLGGLILVMGYLSQLYEPLKTIGRKTASLQSHMASAERALALLDEAPDVQERPNARTIQRARGAVSFKNVSFTYGDGRTVLRHVSFDIPPGYRLGISGATGAGKTTLVSLLTRFYDPAEGAICLDGIDLRDYRVSDLRNQFGIVLQEPVLFSTSIAENIAYARPQATEAEIIAAAKAANVHDAILRLPAGYATIVGERGMRLSGGERQRLSLARAFLKDAPILILDEPTSSVDIQTEAGIIQALERLMRGRTTIMIAHRLSTLEHCDGRLELAEGSVLRSSGGRMQHEALA